MDSEYKEIFETLYHQPRPEQYPNLSFRYFALTQDPFREDSVVIHQAIDSADIELFSSSRRRLRADAKYFLLLNFMEMVFLPIRMRGAALPEDLRSLLRSDMGLVVTDAARRQEERERTPEGNRYVVAEVPELSGHSILESIAFNWKNLKLSDLRVWGED